MKDRRIWVVALDLTPMDKTILDYVSKMSEALSPKEVHFVHVLAEFDNYAYDNSEFRNLMNMLAAEKLAQVEKKVATYFSKSTISFFSHLEQGEPFEEIIRLSTEVNASGVIVGKKRSAMGSGIISERLSRNLPCDFLLIPASTTFRLERIMVATDFSDHSSLAMVKAQDIKDSIPTATIYAHHSYAVPMGYSKSGKTFEQYANIVLATAEDAMKKWLKQFKHACTPVFSLVKSDDTSSRILASAVEKQVDMIVMGSKGQSRISLAFLGSYTLKLLKQNQKIPVLIVKKEGENMNLLDALKRM
jgi:nucleotide-binding universal stress UspA family protein